MSRPLRVLHGADFHIGLTRYGHATGSGSNSRVEDFLNTLDRFADAALDRKVDVAVLAGDTFHTRHENPYVRAEFSREVERLAKKCLVIVLPGNHDGASTVADQRSHSLRWLHELQLPNVVVPLQPMRAMQYVTEGGPVSVTAYPYPHKRSLDVALAHLDPDDRVLEAGRLLEADIATIPEFMTTSAPRLFVGHLTVGGSTVGSEQAMKLSWDVAITPHVLEAWDYAALGHIHKQQRVPGSTKAWYAGSPEYVDFSEVNDIKGFLYVEMELGKAPVVEVVPSGARVAQRFALHEGAEPGDYRFDLGLLKPGAIVRADFHPREKPDLAVMAAIERAFLAEGASFVKTVVVMPERPDAVRIDTNRDAVDGLDSQLDIAEATRRWLVANDYPEEPTMTAARQVIAAVGGT